MPKRATPAVRFIPYADPPKAPPNPRPALPRPLEPAPGRFPDPALRASPSPPAALAPGAAAPRRSAAAAAQASSGSAYATDGALALSTPPRTAERPRPPNPLRLVRPDERAESDLRGIARATVRLVVEVLAGTRTPHHLAHLAIPEVCHGLAAHRRPVAAGARIAPSRILTTWLQEPAPGTAETGAVVVLDGRVQALALRLERRRGRWRCTALETTGAPGRRGR